MTDPPRLVVFAKSMPAPSLDAAHAPSPAPSTAPKPNMNMEGQMRPPGAPKLEKRDGESAEQAVQRHVEDHDAHLKELETSFGVHVPRGTATIMKGLPGSGKSHYLKNHHLLHGLHMHVDVDALKPLATGEKDFVYPPHYPDSHPTHPNQPHPLAGQQIHDTYDEGDPVHVSAAHPVSKRLEAQQYKEAMKRRIPMALDTTGGNHDRWGKRVDELRANGYHHVGMVDVRVSKATSEKRNSERRRVVSQKVIDDTFAEHNRDHPDNHGKTPFEHLAPKMDSVHVVDHEPREVSAITKRAAAGWHNYLTSKSGGTGPNGEKMVKADTAEADAPNPFRGMVLGLIRSH